MGDFARDECKAWNDLIFDLIYMKIFPKRLPPITTKVSLKMATGLSKKSFPKMYKSDT
jgi:hypothetical protein